MKVRTELDNHREEIVIYTDDRDEAIIQLEGQIKSLFEPTFLQAKKNGETYRLQQSAIIRIYRYGRKLEVETIGGNFERSSSLKEVEPLLGEDFIKISQSEIINRTYVKNVRVTRTGLVELKLHEDTVAYSSRRYVAILKERL